MKEKRKKQVKLRKNFFPLLVITLIFWTLLFFIFWFIDPFGSGSIPLFLSVFFITVTLTFSIVFANTRRGALTSLGLTLYLILRYFGIGHIINFLLIFGILLSFEIYLTKK
ncbi:hypothetical protein A2141_04065 [Candidatus Woesebacteria bacterium RBG_16_40_11]|uniref:Uncharacterized protein n=1 Tax=Candidatus Woesebacteria bacterium RIFCSPHIGHO2_01_FULL_40_22 TaxID=1802499 RepID=A0A1F7YLJ8_9BACT|nr:MAG: hypothetical protein A2141_04065 [Candidatus Woesebacteria bacterium RBG_16_40_11]OGM27759.1 MAG: hypothetical protein A2628_05060 [Candidatus Woesebacteria bacterium RIFCSPHIGHO2_01_FULL_40_22]